MSLPSTARQARIGAALILLHLITASLAAPRAAATEAHRALAAGKLPADKRLGPLKDLNGYFPFQVPDTREAWEARAAKLRRQIRVACGLWPEPKKTPANAVIHGQMDLGDYTIEKVYFESYPGHFVTGNLYRPKGTTGRLPAVLSPHGHWNNGRFYDTGTKQIRRDLVEGAERFELGGRSPLQSRCVQLARMGCVVFHYDMVGYGDSIQLDHRPGLRDAMNTTENWGYFSPQAELHLQDQFGLQSYNSLRALDFLCELPDVDPERVAVTGASGGGTQTFILCAIDPRPKVAFPAVMVSTAMQGGCTCENAPFLRIGTGNVEIAALFAPKPLGMTGANDWTREIATKGFPELKKLYALYGDEAQERVMAKPLVQFGHNYNYVSRAVMYSWLNQHLGLGLEEPVVEEDYKLLSPAQLSVWDEQHPKPPAGPDYERSLLRHITDEIRSQLAEVAPKNAQSLGPFRDTVGGAWSVLVGGELPAKSDVSWENLAEEDRGDHVEYRGLLREPARGAELPAIFLYPKNWNHRVVIWLDERGKQGLFDTGGGPIPAVAELLKAGNTVAALDVLHVGEFTADGQPVAKAPMLPKPLVGYAGYTFGYNLPLFSQRVRDVLTLVSYVKHHDEAPQHVSMVGLGGAGIWAAGARALAREAVDAAAIDTAGFRFASLAEFDDPRFVPGAVRYGDVPALLALSAPAALWVTGESAESAPLLQGAYAGSESLHWHAPASADAASAAVAWITGQK